MEPNSPDDKLYNQIEEAYGKVTYSQTTHVKESELMKKSDLCIKWASIILSVVTTGGLLGYFFTDIEMCLLFSVCTSMLTVMLSSMMKSIDYNGQSKMHKEAADELWIVREKYLALLIDYEGLTKEEVLERRDVLTEITADIYRRAPTTNEKSYRKAQEALQNNEEQFFSDEELNNMLPEVLRRNRTKQRNGPEGPV